MFSQETIFFYCYSLQDKWNEIAQIIYLATFQFKPYETIYRTEHSNFGSKLITETQFTQVKAYGV
jgi:hypothetical protein